MRAALFLVTMKSNLPDSSPGAIAVYHAILETESLSTGAGHVLELLQKAQREHPGQARSLVLDIDGRRVPAGAFLPEVQVFISDTVRGFFGQFVTDVIVAGVNMRLPCPQRNDIPDRLPSA